MDLLIRCVFELDAIVHRRRRDVFVARPLIVVGKQLLVHPHAVIERVDVVLTFGVNMELTGDTVEADATTPVPTTNFHRAEVIETGVGREDFLNGAGWFNDEATAWCADGAA